MKLLKLYLLKRLDDTHNNWDITIGQVIAADSEEEALNLSSFEDYTSDKGISVKEIGKACKSIEKGIILEDYKNG